MDDKQAQKVLAVLTELVVWYGEESNVDYMKRLMRANRLVRRIAPELISRELSAVKALNSVK